MRRDRWPIQSPPQRDKGMKRSNKVCERPSTAFIVTLLMVFQGVCFGQAATSANFPATQSGQLDLRSYRGELARISDASKNPQEIAEVRRSLPDSWSVKNGQRIYEVSTKEISQALRQIEHNPKSGAATQLQARLREMRQQAEELEVPGSAVDAAKAEPKLQSILKRNEFQAGSGPSLWDMIRARINRWIFEHLMRLLSVLHISEKTGNSIAWGVIFAAVVLGFYVLYRWLAKSAKTVDFHARVEQPTSDAREWLGEALAAADRGDYREAIHCGYWAAVTHLEDHRILPRDRARTPRESLRLLEQHPKEQRLLQGVTGSFELIWYGYRPVSAAEWTGTKEQLEKMGCLQGSTAPTGPS
jgi:Domain of unknown function (DUF4129)